MVFWLDISPTRLAIFIVINFDTPIFWKASKLRKYILMEIKILIVWANRINGLSSQFSNGLRSPWLIISNRLIGRILLESANGREGMKEHLKETSPVIWVCAWKKNSKVWNFSFFCYSIHWAQNLYSKERKTYSVTSWESSKDSSLWSWDHKTVKSLLFLSEIQPVGCQCRRVDVGLI